MPPVTFESVGVKSDVKAELEKFRAELILLTGKSMPLSDVVRIALHAVRGRAGELLTNTSEDES